MFIPLGNFSPEVNIGLVSASRSCFPRELSVKRTAELLKACEARGLKMFAPEGECAIIETKEHAAAAAGQMKSAGCDAAVLYLGNFSPEIEAAVFVREFGGCVMMMAAAEESVGTLCSDRGDALCGLMSAAMAVEKRGLMPRVHMPGAPVVDIESGADAAGHFFKVVRTVKGIRGATIGLYGPRPRDFETCNYNMASVASIGVEVEELALFDLANEIKLVDDEKQIAATIASMREDAGATLPPEDFTRRLAVYEIALLRQREALRLSGAATQCWIEQELSLRHVPCFINARLTGRGFPVACENDTYSLIAELLCQYASDSSVTMLDINHSIPADMLPAGMKAVAEDIVGLFHCGNTAPCRLVKPELKYQVMMNRLHEPPGEPPDFTRGTMEGMITPSSITVSQVYGSGDSMIAYIAQGEFLDLDPATFGGVGVAHIPGFRRFYRHALLGRFHHHAAVAFGHCGAVLFDAFKLLGIKTVYTPLLQANLYPGENPF